MANAGSDLFATVPEDHLKFSVYKDRLDYSKVVDFLEFGKKDVSQATGVPLSSVRYDDKMPNELVQRVKEWAMLLNLVAEHFQGDGKKTHLWFTLRNPMLGNIAPRDLIRFGRFAKLHKFIWSALEENKR